MKLDFHSVIDLPHDDKPPSFPRVPSKGSWEEMARAYVEICSYLAGGHERREVDLAETKGHALAAMGAAASAQKTSAQTHELVLQLMSSIGMPHPGGGSGSSVTATTMTRTTGMGVGPIRQRAPSFNELEGFTERMESAVEVLRDRPTPVFAFAPVSMPIAMEPPSSSRMDSDRVQGVVQETLQKIEYTAMKEEKKRKEKIVDRVKEDLIRKTVLVIAGLVFAILATHVLWH